MRFFPVRFFPMCFFPVRFFPVTLHNTRASTAKQSPYIKSYLFISIYNLAMNHNGTYKYNIQDIYIHHKN